MFDNIGEKIMSIAKIAWWIELLIFILIGIVMLSTGNPLGLFIAVIGAVFSWFASIVMYGLGQLIDDISAIRILKNEEIVAPKIRKSKLYNLKIQRDEGIISEEEYQHKVKALSYE